MATVKKQIVFVRGGDVFDNDDSYYSYLKAKKYDPYHKDKNWRDWIEWALSENFDMLAPIMPNKQKADYISWKIWFEKLWPYLNDEVVVIGQSLGSTFLIKYLTENIFPKKIHSLHLVSPMTSSEGMKFESISNFKFDLNNINKLSKVAPIIHLYHSQDDDVVPFSHSEQLAKALPIIQFHTFEGRGHFRQPAFPELLQNIYNDLNIVL